MGALTDKSEVLWEAIVSAGLEQEFEDRDTAYQDCPSCRRPRGLKLSLRSGRVHCSSCGVDGALLTYLREREDGYDVEPEEFSEAEVIALVPRAPIARRRVEAIAAAQVKAAAIEPEKTQGKLGERIIMTLLALVFLCTGLAAAALSGFANYQSFSASVTDPMQGQIWGWSGVIASICSFGGFTFFWWHTSSKRMKEGLRALAFALAGAATSVAGTSLYMANNDAARGAEVQQAANIRGVLEGQIEGWTRQLDGIPPETRSVEGLEAYISGVEAAGRTHQKPYRDAQNELGLAKRRAAIEANIADAQSQLLGQAGGLDLAAAPERQSIPSWFFALMLEVFSSQGTSIAIVSLLLLYGVKQTPPVQQEGLV